MALVFLATQCSSSRHNDAIAVDRHRPRLAAERRKKSSVSTKSSRRCKVSTTPSGKEDNLPLPSGQKFERSPSVDESYYSQEESFVSEDEIDHNKSYVSDDDDDVEDYEFQDTYDDFKTPGVEFCNNNNDINLNFNNLRKSSDQSLIGYPVEAFPPSLIKWPLNNGIKSKRLSDIRKQVKHLSNTIKMTIDSDDEHSLKGKARINPAPFSSHVDMNELKVAPLTSSTTQWPSIEEVESVLNSGKIKETKALLRHSNWGMDHIVRKHLWKSLVQHITNETFVDLYYWETVQQIYGTKEISECNVVLPAFVDHKYVSTYGLSTEGIKACERIITVIAYNYPAITYAPLIYPITAIFMHYFEEPDVYNCLAALVSKGSGYIPQTKLLHETMWRTVEILAKKHVRGSFSLLGKFGTTPEQIKEGFQTWTWWMMAKLPLPHLIRIIDSFLFEGSKVLLRVSLGLFHLFMKQVSRDANTAATLTTKGMSEGMALYCTNLSVSPSKLLKTAFGIRALSKNEIKKIASQTEALVKSDPNLGSSSGVASMVRSASLEYLPTSESQDNIQTTSNTMDIKELLTIWSWIPMRMTMNSPKLVYTTQEHGSSLRNFFLRVENYEPTLILIRTTNDEIFGAYCSTAWSQRKHRDEYGHKQTYFGTGETFLFTLKPEVKKYEWVGITQQKENRELSSVAHQSELFLHADTDMISIGGGNGHGLMLDYELQFGKTERCDTFNNLPLCSTPDFEIKVVEVFSLGQVF
ncbi:UNVERIFIED_CONTAM: hypothetical protein RMT77_018387 [Armadillidium vulgare]